MSRIRNESSVRGFRGAGGIPIDYGEAWKPIPGPNASNGAMVAIFRIFALKIQDVSAKT